MTGDVVVATGLTKRFGDLVAVDGISFVVHARECFGVLGPNGAGKSSTLRMVHAASPPTAGELTVFGLPVATRAREVKARLGVVPQDDSLDSDLTVVQNLVVFGAYHGIARAKAKARAAELLDFFALSDRAGEKVQSLSGGMRRRLAIARALVHEPELLVLDEPTTGLDPQARHLIWARLRSLRARGTTMLLTTHYMEEAAQLCDRLVIVDGGRILTEGSPSDLVARHVPPFVVEVRLPTEGAPASDVIAEKSGAAEHELAGDTLYLYGSDAKPIAAAIADGFGLPVLQRPANLEDVFVRLAGRELRD